MNPANPLDAINAHLAAARQAEASLERCREMERQYHAAAGTDPLQPYSGEPPTPPWDPETLPVCGQTCDPAAAGQRPAAAVPTSLEPKETSAVMDFDRWMHMKGTPDAFFAEPVFDTTSASARFRHASWWVIRKRVWASLVRTGQTAARRSAFGACGSWSWIERSDQCVTDFRIRHNHCRDRLCTPCANARSARLATRLFELANGKKPLFITLTLCGKQEPLAPLVDRLYKSFKALRNLPGWADSVRGGAAFLEIKWSDKARRWHPHLHIIADSRYIETGQLSRWWHTITGDSFIVDIRRPPDVAATTRYVTKYASKPLNTSFSGNPDLLDEALKALKGRRLAFAFGDWYGTPLGDIDADELELESAPHYKFFASLEDILDKANRGDSDARGILKLCNAEAVWRAALLIDTS